MAKCEVCGKNQLMSFFLATEKGAIRLCDACGQKMRWLDDVAEADKILENLSDTLKYDERFIAWREHCKKLDAWSAEDKIKAEENAREEERVAEAMKHSDDMIVTSTGNVEGYEITDYCGFVSCETVIPNGLLGMFTSGTFFTIDAVTEAKQRSIEALKEAAIRKHANALVGVDIDVSDLNGNGMMVSANGTAVNIRKIENK